MLHSTAAFAASTFPWLISTVKEADSIGGPQTNSHHFRKALSLQGILKYILMAHSNGTEYLLKCPEWRGMASHQGRI